ncbi:MULTISPECIES: class I SAM-dependent methyltransferase [Mumia]|uniref:class I SAM-dependent methyltransferase n=1 Tax=Mumia TaxID=1546255 RepID=UPI00141E55D8|nr:MULTISPECIES: class I SAM-dependent methyltransferase [unclassified Mumia]QMW66877.1 class I SAM-dependent methyltransferase [Mumia sp. ZJ1417]
MPSLATRPLRLELGCGAAKRDPRAVGIDTRPLPAVDVVGDALEVLRTIPDASVESVYSEHFLEHVDDAREVLSEISRVLVDGGTCVTVVPHFSNPAFYSDPTHRQFFGLYTFGYWVERTALRRGVPHYEAPLPLVLTSTRYVFKSSPPFYARHAVKKVLSAWVNLSTWTQELYEEHVCWILPCYEIAYTVRRVPR